MLDVPGIIQLKAVSAARATISLIGNEGKNFRYILNRFVIMSQSHRGATDMHIGIAKSGNLT
jgi:hypothetical protein